MSHMARSGASVPPHGSKDRSAGVILSTIPPHVSATRGYPSFDPAENPTDKSSVPSFPIPVRKQLGTTPLSLLTQENTGQSAPASRALLTFAFDCWRDD